MRGIFLDVLESNIVVSAAFLLLYLFSGRLRRRYGAGWMKLAWIILAVRLAMCDMALPQGDPCPILLDDVLDPFDDERARLALDCLLEVAQTRQVLLFTCHSREKAMLEGSTYTALEA